MIRLLAIIFVLLLAVCDIQAATTILQRGDTSANWTSVNPVLAGREVGWETDTRKAKLGDGVTSWNSLSYIYTGDGVTDHGVLTGLTDDDHAQYLTNARGDLRYSLLGHDHTAGDVTVTTTSFDGNLSALDDTVQKALETLDGMIGGEAETDPVFGASEAASFVVGDKTKLDGIATGAEVNVNSDWNSASGDSQILNKPSLGTAALLDSGVDIGDVVIWEDDGSGNASIPIGSTDLPLMGDYSVNGTPFDGDANGKIDAALLDATGGASAIGDLTDWPAGVTPTEVGYLDGVTSGIQAQINSMSSASGYVSPPTYSDETCTAGTYSFDSEYFYACKTTDTWDRVAFISWSNPTPTPPTLISATIGTDGTTFTLVTSEAILIGSGGNDGWDVDCATAGSDITATYSSGDTTDTLVYTLGTTVNSGDTCNVDYVQPGDGWEDAQGDDLASITSGSVTNDSTQGGSTYADIVFYANADTASTTPQKGTGPMSLSAGILLETTDPILGAGSWDNNNDGWDSITIPAANINWGDVRIGFYFRPFENAAGRVLSAETSEPLFNLKYYSATQMSFTYKDQSTQVSHGLSTFDGSVVSYIEVVLTGTTAELFIDGVSKGTLTGAGGTAPSGYLMIGATDGNQWDAHYDQVIISDDTERDIYAVRDITDFSD
jgi:hypothetical protein